MTTWDLYCALHALDLTVLGPKCHSVACPEPVAARVHWVTGPIEVCAGCTARWQRIAVALGMVVRVESVEYMPPGLDDFEQRCRLLDLE